LPQKPKIIEKTIENNGEMRSFSAEALPISVMPHLPPTTTDCRFGATERSFATKC
jgi:hypothetical protein